MKRAPVILALAALALAAALATPPPAPARAAATQACPVTAEPVAHCVITPPTGFGTLDVAAAGPVPGTPWAASDPHGAIMGFDNMYELGSVGDGGLEPGGLVCSTYNLSDNVACLTPTGNLILQATGPGGPYGPKVTLTPRLARKLIALVRAGLTPRDVAWIHANGG